VERCDSSVKRSVGGGRPLRSQYDAERSINDRLRNRLEVAAKRP
jgi:hypothetical protein